MAFTRQNKLIYGAAFGTIAASGLYLFGLQNGASAYELGKGDYCTPSKGDPAYKKDDAIAYLDVKADNTYHRANKVGALNTYVDYKAQDLVKYDGAIYKTDGQYYQTQPALDPGAMLFKGDKGYMKTDGTVLAKVDSTLTSVVTFKSDLFNVDAKTMAGLYRTEGSLVYGKPAEGSTTVCTAAYELLASVKSSDTAAVALMTPVATGAAAPQPTAPPAEPEV